MRLARFLGAMCVGVWALSAVPADAQVQLCAVLLSNPGFENCTALPEEPPLPDEWTATVPNANYDLLAPECSPHIVPKSLVSALVAPSGSEFIGVVNAGDDDLSAKIAHEAVPGAWPAGTQFTVTVFANRGRLEDSKTVGFVREKRTSLVQLRLLGWAAGAEPVLSSLDTWSRRPSVNLKQTFTNWGANGSWASQTFTFVTTKATAYVSLVITARNRAQSSYVAFDLNCPN
jgi:hypothetical protein